MKKNKSTYKVLENQIAELNKQNGFIRLNADHENEEKEKRAAELIIANKELAYQNDEKEKRAAELLVANKELCFQSEEKEKRAAELIIANKELAFQNEEKGKRAAELLIANKELSFQNDEKEKKAAELIIANWELIFQNELKEKRAAELVITNNELKQLLQLNLDKDHFIATLAHDLRSPFSSILGFLNLLSENFHNYESVDIEQHINMIRRVAQNTFNLLEDLILWIMSQLGKLPYEPDKLNFEDICKDVIEVNMIPANEKNITIHCSVEEEIIVLADKNMIKTILRNLISNAIKFTNPGGHIDICAEKTKANITVSVSDNGIGISPEILNHLFEISQLHTTKGTENESGSGLGLLLCKEFSEKHGGTISANSEIGKGSTFTFTIPYQESAVVLDDSLQDTASDQLTDKGNEKTILIVEDDLLSHRHIVDVLSLSAFKLLHAFNGLQALEQVKKNTSISLILMDIRMPIMNGFEAALLIKQMRPDVPIIAQTANAFIPGKKEMLQLGFDNCIFKPLEKDGLLKLISNYRINE